MDVFCLLPTGYGKSDIFALYPLIRDKVGLSTLDTTIVVYLTVLKITSQIFERLKNIPVGLKHFDKSWGALNEKNQEKFTQYEMGLITLYRN